VVDIESGLPFTFGASEPQADASSRWSEARSGTALLRAYNRPLGGGMRLDVVGEGKTWTREVPGVAAAAVRLSPDGQIAAIIVVEDSGRRSLKIVGPNRADVTVDLGDATGGLLAFDDSGKRIVTTSYRDAAGSTLWILALDGKVQTQVKLDRGAAASSGTLGRNLWVSFRGDTIWAFTSSFASGGAAPGSSSSCNYVKVKLSGAEGHVEATEADLPGVFGRPGSCDIRAMCEAPDGGVLLLRHDRQVLTVESRPTSL
jgi:hypothetical protein